VAEYVEGSADVYVGDLSGELNFAFEPFNGIVAVSSFESDRLQRDVFPELQILGFVDFPHAAPRD
jgi:hypothetical protein